MNDDEYLLIIKEILRGQYFWGLKEIPLHEKIYYDSIDYQEEELEKENTYE